MDGGPQVSVMQTAQHPPPTTPLHAYEALLDAAPLIPFLSPINENGPPSTSSSPPQHAQTTPPTSVTRCTPTLLEPSEYMADKFFHLKEVSRSNLSSLLESELNVDGEWAHQFAEEEELDVTLHQLLADPSGESKFSILVGEEGQGKTALLRYIWKHLKDVLASQIVESALYIRPTSLHPPTFALYLRAPFILEALAQHQGAPTTESVLNAFIDAISRSWATEASSLAGCRTPPVNEAVRTVVSQLLRTTTLPFALLLDGIELLPLKTTSSLLEGFLGGPPSEKGDYPPEEGESGSGGVVGTDLSFFGHLLQSGLRKRVIRLITCCRYTALTKLMRYDYARKKLLCCKAKGKGYEAWEAYCTDLPHQWRVVRLEKLKGECEEDAYTKALIEQWGLGSGSDARSKLLLGLLNDRKQYILNPTRRTPLLISLIVRDVAREFLAVEAEHQATGDKAKEGNGSNNATNTGSVAVDPFVNVSSTLYEVYNRLVEDIVVYNVNRCYTTSTSNSNDIAEARALLGLVALLVFWWEDNVYIDEAEYCEGGSAPGKQLRLGKITRSQKAFVNSLARVYFDASSLDEASTSDDGRDYFEEAVMLLPGDGLVEMGPDNRIVFKNRTLHQFLVAEFVAVLYHAHTSSASKDETILNRLRRLSDVLRQFTVPRLKLKLNESVREIEAPRPDRLVWEEDAFITSNWWSEVYMFLSFRICFTTVDNPKEDIKLTVAKQRSGGIAVQWLYQRMIKNGNDTLGDWFSRLQRFKTDPADLGQLRFSHLLRAMACEGMVKEIKAKRQRTGPYTVLPHLRQTRELKELYLKGTDFGDTYLCILEESEMALLHLEEYPIYLQIPYCLGIKTSKDITDKCVSMLETTNYIYAMHILLCLEIGGCLGPMDLNDKDGVLAKVSRLLQDQEPRTRKAAVGLLWKLCLQAYSPFFRFSLPRHKNKSAVLSLANPAKMEEEDEAIIKRFPMKGKGPQPTGAELINKIASKLKDAHAPAQDEAVDAMKQLADISLSLLTSQQRSFFLEELLPIVEETGEITTGEPKGLIEWRHLVTSALSLMKMFDLYEWLMRWLSYDQPGMRLLVFTALGLLGYPLLETKPKFDPFRKACCLVLAQLSEGYSPPVTSLTNFVKEMMEKKRIRRPAEHDLSALQNEDEFDEDIALILPFRLMIYHSFGDTAARSSDLDWMMNLLKCKPAFIHKISVIVAKTLLSGESRKQKFAHVLTTYSNLERAMERDKEKPTTTTLPGAGTILDYHSQIRGEVVRLLRGLGGESDVERIGLSLLKPTTAKVSVAAKSGDASFSVLRYEIVSTWLKREIEVKRERKRQPTTTSTDQMNSPPARSVADKMKFTMLDTLSRSFILELISAVPSFAFRSPRFGLWFFSGASLDTSVSEETDARSPLQNTCENYWDYLHLILEILQDDAKDEDFVIEEGALRKCEEMSNRLMKCAFIRFTEETPSSLAASTVPSSLTKQCTHASPSRQEIERRMWAVDRLCCKLLLHPNAYILLSTLRVLSALLVLSTQPRDVIAEPEAKLEEPVQVQASGSETSSNTTATTVASGNWREVRQKQILEQAMALLTHREASVRNQAITLLTDFLSAKRVVLKRKLAGTATIADEGVSGTLDMEEHLVILCSMLRTHIYFVRATAVTVLGIFIRYFASLSIVFPDLPEPQIELKRIEDSIVKVLQMGQKDGDGMVMESAIQSLGFLRDFVSVETVHCLFSMLWNPSRLRVAVLESLGKFGDKSAIALPRLVDTLRSEDNWLRTVAVTQLTSLLKPKVTQEETKRYIMEVGQLLKEDEFYIKECCMQLLCALGPEAIVLCITPILDILNDDDDEEEPCVVELALGAVGLLLEHGRKMNTEGRPDRNLSAVCVSHMIHKLDDNSVEVKKAALKALRKDPRAIASNDVAVTRLTKLLNTFAEETAVQVHAFLLIAEAGRLSVFSHLSPLLGLLHSKDTKVLMKTVNALSNLGARCVSLMPCAINRTKSHEMRRRLLSLLLKYEPAYDACYCADADSPEGDSVKQQRREIAFLFKHRDSILRRFAFKTIGNYYEARSCVTLDGEGDLHESDGLDYPITRTTSSGGTSSTGAEDNSNTNSNSTSNNDGGVSASGGGGAGGSDGNDEDDDDDDEEDDVVLFSSNYWKKYKRAILVTLKDQSSRKSRMEAVLALGRFVLTHTTYTTYTTHNTLHTTHNLPNHT
eukprot:TRINITY_DN3494_c0_g1_i7.p1 TRINITY_DN3494_c0_g1~~TRINITY_DN3494_c0_g1_i7.p1  ORF type:complete len:2222 (-),score=349.50 TRINITY_DN3494_c0_g1_i7:16-6594(-)